MTTTQTAPARDEAQIRQLIADQMSALGAKDLDRLMSHYAADVVIFDVKPPFQTKGAAALRRLWEACLPYFPDSFQTELRDLTLTVGGDLALAHWLWRFTGMEQDHPAMQTWIRSTAGYRRVRGGWQIVHEHVSVPFHPETGLAAFTLSPESSN
jgi:ketosteroid isomerase-like protein